ncbi:PREDICTED: ADM2 [Rhinopithecus bieti]|uniref:Adrenomedullin 2 n=1 Tax=Rhinopithecus bieti TaxID=61621 RepID=A0A2K6L250_RHIBE|nr:PREDICTED: ADM2 [Rhinopithecus bieti]
MARISTAALGCISLLCLQLPGVLSRSLGGDPRPVKPREPPARTPSSNLQPRHPAPRPVVWKLHQALQPHRGAGLAPAMGQPLRDGGRQHSGPRRHSGSRRTQAQLLRVGCVLGTCQVQNLSHRLWQLMGPAGRQDSAPVDPGSPHSYG